MTLLAEQSLSNDLHWACVSLGLIRTPKYCSEITDILSIDPQDLAGFDCRQFHGRNLGSYYENLVHKLLLSADNTSAIHRNIKVYDGKVTLGEMDFIGRINSIDFHLECAVKFYLRVDTGSELSHFIGPGKKDRLDIKYERMLSHQLKLSQTSLGKLTCAKLDLAPTLLMFLLQGYLFHPFDEFVASHTTSLHPDINPDHLQGWWLRQSELEKLKFSGYFATMRKPNWLLCQSVEKMDFKQLSELITETTRPVLIARLDLEGEELDRGFVVPDNW